MRALKYSIIAISLLMLTLMGVGLALSGEWQAEAALEVAAPPEAVYPLLEDLRRWDEWTLWGDVESTFAGAPRGTGAVRSWKTEEFGSGNIQITDAQELTHVLYEVDVDEGSLKIFGRLELEATPAGTLIRWEESGDFGWNPLMGYQARFMSKAQGAQLEESLRRLASVFQEAGS